MNSVSINSARTVILALCLLTVISGCRHHASPASADEKVQRARAEAARRDEGSARVLFTNVRIFDGKSEQLQSGHVLVVGNVIAKVSAKPIEAGDNTTVIEGGGRTLMPGLIDGHAHLAIAASFADIENNFTAGDMHIRASVAARRSLDDGFTTVRDMGGMVFGLKRAIDQGVVPGPRIYPSGPFISQTSGHGDFRAMNDPNPSLSGIRSPSNFLRLGLGVVADGRAAVLAATRQNLMYGASQIKIMGGGGGSSVYDPIDVTQYTADEIRAAVEAAENWGTYVGAHIFTDRAVRLHVENGVKALEHAFFMSDDTVRWVASKGVFVVPQCWGFSDEVLKNPNVPEHKKPEIAKLLAPAQKNLGRSLLKHKAKVVFASDLVGEIEEGVRWRRYELYWRTEVFGSNFEVLKQATSVAGELLALTGPRNPYPGKLGVVEEGALADLLLVDGNPLEDITVLGAETSVFDAPVPKPIETIRVIMKDGRFHKNAL
jgi:imidazolonepropionase-like amidohydrolase